MSALPVEVEEDFSSNRIIPFPTSYTGYNTNPYPLPYNFNEGLDKYVKSLIYSILYTEKILRYSSVNSSFNSIVFKDLKSDEINSYDSQMISKISRQIEDLSDSINFE